MPKFMSYKIFMIEFIGNFVAKEWEKILDTLYDIQVLKQWCNSLKNDAWNIWIALGLARFLSYD